jgi:hypothetical protein
MPRVLPLWLVSCLLRPHDHQARNNLLCDGILLGSAQGICRYHSVLLVSLQDICRCDGRKLVVVYEKVLEGLLDHAPKATRC